MVVKSGFLPPLQLAFVSVFYKVAKPCGISEALTLGNVEAFNTFSTGADFYHKFGYDKVLLTLGWLFEVQEINGHCLYYFNPHMSF